MDARGAIAAGQRCRASGDGGAEGVEVPGLDAGPLLAAEGGAHPDTTKVDALAEACFRSADYQEGQAAFLAKREPVFKGA